MHDRPDPVEPRDYLPDLNQNHLCYKVAGPNPSSKAAAHLLAALNKTFIARSFRASQAKVADSFGETPSL